MESDLIAPLTKGGGTIRKHLPAILTLLLAPLATGLLLLALCWRYELYPLGHNTLAWCDMLQQVTPLWMQLRDILTGEVSPFYSFRAAGGMSLWGVLFFFLASPFSLLVVLWEKADILYFANVVTFLKLMLCSLTAMWALRRRRPGMGVAASVLLALCYAFSGYSLMYYQNSVWLDVMALFPLLWLSTEGLLKKGGGRAYTLLLTLALVVNYYIGYAVVLFLLLCCGLTAVLRLEREQVGRYALRAGCHTALALLLSAPVWLPSLFQVMASARTGSIVASLAAGSPFTAWNTTLPLLYCAIVPLALLPLAQRSIQTNRRDGAEAALLVLMLIPVLIDPINKVWHTGSYQAFPVRYGFIPIFLGLSLAGAALEELARAPKNGKRSLHPLGGALAVGGCLLLSAVLLVGRWEELTVYLRKLWGNGQSLGLLTLWALALGGTALLLALWRRKGALSQNTFLLLVAVLVVGQSLFSGAVYIGGAARDGRFMEPIADLEGQIEDTGFFRVKTEHKLFDVNLLGGIGYNNLAHYTSLTREDYLLTVRALGYSGYWMEVGSQGGSLVTDALLNVDYTIRTQGSQKYYERQVYANKGYRVFQNPVRLPFGVVSPASLESLATPLSGDRPMVGQQVLERLLGLVNTKIVTRLAPNELVGVTLTGRGQTVRLDFGEKDEEAHLLRYHIGPADEDRVIYLDCYDGASNRLRERVNDGMAVMVNGSQKVASYPTQRENGLLELGYLPAGNGMSVELRLKKELEAESFGVFVLSLERLEQAAGRARGADLTVGQRDITGSATALADGELLFLPIPYAEGWRATVNGKPAEIRRVFGTLMALELAQGENDIALTFFPAGLLPSLGLVVAGVLAGLLAVLARRRGAIAAGRRLEQVAGAVLLGCLALELLLVYVAPVLINLLL